MADREPLLDAKEVARQLGLSRSGVYRLVHRGELPRPIQVGGRSRWKQSDVDALRNRPRRLRKPRRPKGQGPEAA